MNENYGFNQEYGYGPEESVNSQSSVETAAPTESVNTTVESTGVVSETAADVMTGNAHEIAPEIISEVTSEIVKPVDIAPDNGGTRAIVNSSALNDGTAGSTHTGMSNTGSAYTGSDNAGSAYIGSASTGNANSAYAANANNNSAYAANGYAGAQYTKNRYNMDHIPSEPKKKKSAGGGLDLLKRAAAAVLCGILFGIFAGAGIYAINLITDKLDGGKESSRIEDVAPPERESNDVISSATTDASPADIGKPEFPGQPDMPLQGGVAMMDASSVVENCMPSIVAITNKYTYTQTYQYFFGPSQRVQEQAEASGSGIIVGETDDELLVVTNQHVIENADELSIQFVDGESYDAAIKGAQTDQDLAVIAVKLADMKDSTKNAIKIAALGDSDALKVGEPAIAIGNSLGYGQSVTCGIISAVDRDFEYQDTTRTVIQTDAAINPGNSGGALLNKNGEVVGINEAKYADTAVEGVGYAIPISAAKPIIEELSARTTRTKIADGKTGFLGVGGVDVTEDVAQMYGMPIGVYISNVGEGTGAEAGGIVKGDIITQFDGEGVSTMEELRKVVSYYQAGDVVSVTLQRTGQNGYEEVVLSVTLGERPTEQNNQ